MQENYMEYPERLALQTVLDFVENWNKKDEDKEVAQAAYEVQDWLDKVNAKITAQL